MSIDAINLALTLNDRQYKDSMDKNHSALLKLGSMPRDTSTGRFIKGTTGQLKTMEEQAKRTQRSMGGLIGGMDRVSRGLIKIGRIAQVGGLGIGGIGLASQGIGKLLGIGTKTKKGALPPIPGTATAKRAALSKRLQGFGEKASRIGGMALAGGTGVKLLGNAVGIVPGIAKLFSSSKNAGGAVSELTSKIGNMSAAAGKAQNSSSGLSKGLGALRFSAIGAAAAVLTIGVGLGAMATSGLKMNSNLEESKAQFEVFTGSALKADAIVTALSRRADITPFNTMDYIEGGTALMSAAEGSKDKLMELMKTAEMLTVLNPKEGLAGAAVAMKNALSGDFMSLQDRFNIAPSTIKKFKDAGKTGQDLIRSVLKEMNIGENSMMRLGKTVKGLWSTVSSFFDNVRMKLSEGLFANIQARLSGIADWISTNQTWVLDVATGIGMKIGQMAQRAWTFATGLIQIVTPAVMKIADIVVSMFGQGTTSFIGAMLDRVVQVVQWVSNLVQSINLNSIGQSIWNIFKEIGSMLFDVLSAAGEAIGARIVEKLPTVLGGGKSSTQEFMDKTQEGLAGMSDEARQKTLKQRLADLKDEQAVSGNKISYNGFQKKIEALEALQRGEKVIGVKSIGSVMDAHVKKAASMIPKFTNGSSTPNVAAAVNSSYAQGHQFNQMKLQQQAGINWGNGMQRAAKAATNTNQKQLQMMEDWNAKAEGRAARNIAAHDKYDNGSSTKESALEFGMDMVGGGSPGGRFGGAARGGRGGGVRPLPGAAMRRGPTVTEAAEARYAQKQAGYAYGQGKKNLKQAFELRVTSMDGTISPLSS